MYICERCYEECDLIPIEVSDEDESLDIELYSDCCFDSYLLTDEDEVASVTQVIEAYENGDIEFLSERELVIGRYLNYEV